jgi:hypothetical protein
MQPSDQTLLFLFAGCWLVGIGAWLGQRLYRWHRARQQEAASWTLLHDGIVAVISDTPAAEAAIEFADGAVVNVPRAKINYEKWTVSIGMRVALSVHVDGSFRSVPMYEKRP